VNKSSKPILDVLQGKTPEHRPLWLMRQAGRYLPEYRDLRAKSKNFLNMCFNPEAAIEITLQPIRRFGMDAAILFSDILVVPMALGRALEFREGEGPYLPPLEPTDVLTWSPEVLNPIYATLRGVTAALSPTQTMIGFCGAPWTIACYMIDGNSANDFARTQSWVTEHGKTLEKLLNQIAEVSADYLIAQIHAGAEVVQIFDSWAGLAVGDPFNHLVIEPTKVLVKKVRAACPTTPIIGFPRLAGDHYEDYAKQTGVTAMGIDQTVDLIYARDVLQPILPLQGNLSPDLLVAGGQTMRDGLKQIMDIMGPRHILNLGHGVVPQTPPEHVADMVSFVQNYQG
jgi:uroporphyrinogen decarboxylase